MKNSRRQFLKNLGAVSGGLVGLEGLAASGTGSGAVKAGHSETPEQPRIEKDFIHIKNPRKLSIDRLRCERVYLGSYYKPCVARLPNDELRLVAEATTPHEDLHGKNDHPIFRSADGGRTWSKLVVPDLTGGEPYLTTLKDGTLIMTGDIWIRSKGSSGRNVGYMLHRSEDGGQTWVNPETAAVPMAAKDVNAGSRNVLELADGSLMFAFGGWPAKDPKKVPEDFIWRSFDGGRTWPEKYPAPFEDTPANYEYTVLVEAHLWQARSGKVYALARVSPHFLPFPGRGIARLQRGARYQDMRDDWKPGQQPYTGPDGVYLDDYDRLLVYSSTDLGRTWKKVRDFGDYGEGHYPSMLRLQDGRLLITFTVRAGKDQLGMQAVLASETVDGFDFDLEHDRISIETKTPMNQVSGGGFGPTVQLKDGTLVTAYSYRLRKTNAGLYSEVVRWRLPAPK